MSRLLFAVARGARIQYRSPIDRDWKESAFRLWPSLHDCKTADSLYRIHPEDAHLAYGPISTALREMAEDYSWNPRDAEERALALVVARQFQACLDDETDFELYYLFLAEALADEGM